MVFEIKWAMRVDPAIASEPRSMSRMMNELVNGH